MNRLRHIFQWELRSQEAKAIVLFVLGWLLARLSKREPDLWLFAERGTDARDNGWWMFRYVMEQHPEVNAHFVISPDSEDYQRLERWSDRLIPYNSLRHYIWIWKASRAISTHVSGYLPYYIREVPAFRRLYHRWSPRTRLIWIQHGVIMNNMKQFHFDRTYLDLLICGAKPEYDFIARTFGFPQGVVRYTGLARHDGLHQVSVNHKQILLMPTWRQWLLKRADFMQSDYRRIYTVLLTDPRLHAMLQTQGCNLIFYPHYEVQPYIEVFQELPLPGCVQIADKIHYDVQSLLKESALLITDYSSVGMDFAYMRKPIIYFQFDESTFFEGHYTTGYYDYHEGLGDWCSEIDQLLELIQLRLAAGLQMPACFRKRADAFFPLYDQQNCRRNYEAILETTYL